MSMHCLPLVTADDEFVNIDNNTVNNAHNKDANIDIDSGGRRCVRNKQKPKDGTGMSKHVFSAETIARSNLQQV